jgi:signal transduction histidine kinase
VDDSSRLLSWLSHELRTPLSTVLGYAQLLQLDALTADQRRSVAEITLGGNAMIRTLDDAVDFARLRDGELKLASEPVAVDGVLAQASRSARQEGRSTPCGAAVVGDPARLEQALTILLLQAAALGDVETSCRAADGHVWIEIRADGHGLDAAWVEGLFTPFVQRTSSIEGGPLRLPLAKLLVEAMGGTAAAGLEEDRLLLRVELPQG